MCRDKRYPFVVVVLFVTLLILTGWGDQLEAQQKYPTRAIEWVVPYSAGGSSDLVSRVGAEYLRKQWGVPINVVNKTGGLGVPAALEVYKANPDGYTVLACNLGTTSLLLVSVKDLPFEIMDRTFLGISVAVPYIYIVPFNSPLKSLKDLEADVKKDPGNFTWASVGGASGLDLAVRKFTKAIRVDVTKTRPVLCKGGAEALNLTASGAAKLAVVSIATSKAAIAGKLVRPLAVTTSKRWPKMPDVPTVGEAGYPPSVEFREHTGVSGPPNMPSYIVEMWDKALEEMVKDPEVVAKIDRLEIQPIHLNARETRELRLKEIEEAKELYGVK